MHFCSAVFALDLVARASAKLAKGVDAAIANQANSLISVVAEELKTLENKEDEIKSPILKISLYKLGILLAIPTFRSIEIDATAFDVLDDLCELLELASECKVSFISSLSIEFPAHHQRYNLTRLADALNYVPIESLIVKNYLSKTTVDCLWHFQDILFSVKSWAEIDSILFLINQFKMPQQVPRLTFEFKDSSGHLQRNSLSILETFFESLNVSVSLY
jgi:hypothetical protein